MISGKIFTGIAAGLAAGIVVGILIAPDKGSVTIKKMTDKADEYAVDLKGIFTDGMKGVSDKLQGISGKVNDLIEKSLLGSYNIVRTENNDANNHYLKS